jgi:hypothetical protein
MVVGLRNLELLDGHVGVETTLGMGVWGCDE